MRGIPLSGHLEGTPVTLKCSVCVRMATYDNRCTGSAVNDPQCIPVWVDINCNIQSVLVQVLIDIEQMSFSLYSVHLYSASKHSYGVAMLPAFLVLLNYSSCFQQLRDSEHQTRLIVPTTQEVERNNSENQYLRGNHCLQPTTILQKS